jgi:hypothetical protein
MAEARQSILMFGIAGLACLGGCTPPQVSAKTAYEPIQPAAFTVHTPIDRIAANERGKAVLDRDVPGVMNNPHYELFCAMSLSQLASLSGGKLTKEKLDQVNEDLAELSPSQ